jgi:hypothetical protein
MGPVNENIFKQSNDDVLRATQLLDDLYKNSGLPDSIDDNFINDLLLEIREVK